MQQKDHLLKGIFLGGIFNVLMILPRIKIFALILQQEVLQIKIK